MSGEWQTAARCSAHGSDWCVGCPVCEAASKVTWTDNVRANRPDAPDWLWVWAAAMDGQDILHARLVAIEARRRHDPA